MAKANHSGGRRAPLLLVLLLLSAAVSGCSLTDLPGMRQNNNGSQPQATATTGAAAGQQTGQQRTPTAQAQGQVGGEWQVPAEQQAIVQVVEQVSPAVVTVVNRLDDPQG